MGIKPLKRSGEKKWVTGFKDLRKRINTPGYLTFKKINKYIYYKVSKASPTLKY
jgi:hypothetical protein